MKFSSAGISASRRERLRIRYADLKSRKTIKRMVEVMANRQGEITDHTGEGRRGTYLVSKIPNTKSSLTSCLSTIGFGVLVERAPHVGWALKAQRLFTKNCYITQYEGSLMTRSESLRQYESSSRTHFIGLASTLVIDGTREPICGRGGGCFANHSRTPNSYFYKLGGNVYLRAKVDITPGQWITVSYGDRFLSTAGKDIHGDIADLGVREDPH